MAASPAVAAGGGLLSHFVLDLIPHTEGRTFRTDSRKSESLFSPDLIEAGLELLCGALFIAWLSRCPAAHASRIALATLAALLPDLIDQPLNRLFQIQVLHASGLHWTVTRRHAVWGILTQLAVVGAGGLALLKLAHCV